MYQNQFSLSDAFYLVLNYIRTIMISTLFISIIFTIYAFTIATETYESDVDVYITPVTESDNTSTDYSIARYLITTIAEYMESNAVVDEVILDLDLNITREEFVSKLAVTASTDSYRINVAYEDVDPVITKTVVNRVVSVVIDNQTSDSSEDFLPDTIKLVGVYESQNGSYSGPNKVLYVAIGIILGGIIGLSIAFIREMINNSFKTKEQLESEFDIEVLGVIPEFIIKEDF